MTQRFRRNRPNIRRVRMYRGVVRMQRASDRRLTELGIPTDTTHLVPQMTDFLLDLSKYYRFSRGPRRLWKARRLDVPRWEDR